MAFKDDQEGLVLVLVLSFGEHYDGAGELVHTEDSWPFLIRSLILQMVPQGPAKRKP